MFNFFSKGRKILFTGSKRWPKSCSQEPEKECSKVVISAATIVAAVAVVLLVVVVVVVNSVAAVDVVIVVTVISVVAVVVAIVAVVAAAAVVAVVIVVNDTDLYNSNETSRDVTKFFLGMFTFNNDTVEK